MNRLLLGICGSSMAGSALEIAQVVSSQDGVEVSIILTPAAEGFCSAASLAQHFPVYRDCAWSDRPLHVQLADAHDCFFIAPATMNSLAKIAIGAADNLLLATLLCHAGPAALLVAGNSRMWTQRSVQRNADQIRRDGYLLPDPLPMETESGAMPLP